MLKIVEEEVEAHLVEAAELLAKPAGEFTPRLRRIMHSLVATCARRSAEFENADTDPHIPAPKKPFTVPPKPATPRAPQETMEITMDQMIGPWSVTVKPPQDPHR